MSNIEKWHKFKPLPADIQQRIENLPALFASEDVQLAYLFGSLAAGREAKDIDLALREYKDTIHLRRIQDELLSERMRNRIKSW